MAIYLKKSYVRARICVRMHAIYDVKKERILKKRPDPLTNVKNRKNLPLLAALPSYFRYFYTILSKQLIFASVTGKLKITTTNKIMLFNYALGVDDPLTFKIYLEQNGTTTNSFRLYSDTNNVDLIRENLTGTKVYVVTCVIYDKDGLVKETFNHTHQSSGSCGDSWTASNLIEGQTYTLQLRFTDSSDTTKTYLSDITNFTFKTNYGYKMVYDVAKN